MAEKYLKQLAVLMERVVQEPIKGVTLECKHFFSGAAVYVNGKICISLTPAGFALKLPEELRDNLRKEKGAKPLRYFPKAPIKKEYVILPKKIVGDLKELKPLVRQCIKYIKKRNTC